MFDHFSKHLEVGQKYSAERHTTVFSTLFSVLRNVVKYSLQGLMYMYYIPATGICLAAS